MDAKSAVQIGLAVALLLSLVATFFNTKTWRIPQVVFAFLVFLAGFASWYLAAATLKMQDSWRTAAGELQERVAEATADAKALRAGTNDEALKNKLANLNPSFAAGSVKRLESELLKLLNERGRVWSNTTPGPPDPTGKTEVTIESPNPHHLNANSIVFVFEQGTVDHSQQANPPRYLGEFDVVEALEGKVVLEPALEPSAVDLERIQGSRGPWIIYEVMPPDRSRLFADMNEQQLRGLFPKTAEEYLRDGKPAQPGDPDHRVVAGIYRRPLRDYQRRLRELHRQRHVNEYTQLQLQNDTKLIQDAVAKAEEAIKLRQQRIAELQSDLEKFQQEKKVVAAHHDRVGAALAAVTQRLEQARRQLNESLTELVQLHLQAAEKVERQISQAVGPGAVRVELVEE